MNWIFLDSLVWTLASEWDIYRWLKKSILLPTKIQKYGRGESRLANYLWTYQQIFWCLSFLNKKKVVAKNSSNSDEGFSIFSAALFKYYYFQGVIIKQRFGLSFRQEPLLDWHDYRMQWIYINIGSTYIIFLQVHFLY